MQRHYEELDNSDQVENIEVPASHIGLGFNALVMYVLADRLSQKEGQWKPFETSTLTKLIFRKPSKETTARRSTSADFVIS